MIIEITGAGFSNKGAELMMATVCQRLRAALPGVQLCMPMSYAAFEDRARYGLNFTLRALTHWTAPRHLAGDLLSNLVGRSSLGRAYGIIPEREVDGLIDISGYAFGDRWAAAKTLRFARLAAAYRKRGKPVVMLPQMFGPFTAPGQVEAFAELSRQVDLMYAREQESFDAARPVVVDPDRLRMAPDITIPTAARPADTPDRDYICLVANSKLLQPNPQGQDWSHCYLDRLAGVADQAIGQGLAVVIVQHEYRKDDEQLARDLHARIGVDRCTVFRHPDPLVLKGFLGGARLVVGSRFHSLVSTLSMGVPAITLGWAHKYDALMRDFGIPEAIHRAADPQAHLTALVDAALQQHDEQVAIVTERKAQMAEAVEQMWREVVGLFGGRLDGAGGACKSDTGEVAVTG